MLVVVPGHVPEPVTVVGVLAGIGALGGYIRRRRKLV
ncbi:MAG: PEP-CTERM sorting domain-containing protein [Phycisphaerae bacterium]|nr:PEP-CTERM sorting domain-containing protein [Phycisphaerae bacterium]